MSSFPPHPPLCCGWWRWPGWRRTRRWGGLSMASWPSSLGSSQGQPLQCIVIGLDLIIFTQIVIFTLTVGLILKGGVQKKRPLLGYPPLPLGPSWGENFNVSRKGGGQNFCSQTLFLDLFGDFFSTEKVGLTTPPLNEWVTWLGFWKPFQVEHCHFNKISFKIHPLRFWKQFWASELHSSLMIL